MVAGRRRAGGRAAPPAHRDRRPRGARPGHRAHRRAPAPGQRHRAQRGRARRPARRLLRRQGRRRDRPPTGALALLAELRDARVPTALVSASPRRVVDMVLGTIGRDWFAVTLAAEDTPRTKPAPDPYLAAAEHLGLDPAACVAVEDTPTGVASATAAGCAVLAVPSSDVAIPDGSRITLLDSLERADLALLGKISTAPGV
ncbi:HAD family hydrolase [Kitasatospora aburaviensis]